MGSPWGRPWGRVYTFYKSCVMCRYDPGYLVYVDENKIINFHSYQKSYKNNLLVLKLHGSLNWAVCSKCNKIHLFWSQKYDHIFEKRCEDCNANLEPLLIPPTIYKDLSVMSTVN